MIGTAMPDRVNRFRVQHLVRFYCLNYCENADKLKTM